MGFIGWILVLAGLWIVTVLVIVLVGRSSRRQDERDYDQLTADAALLADCFYSTNDTLSFRQCCEAHHLFEDRTTV